jgi:hypothetical protein
MIRKFRYIFTILIILCLIFNPFKGNAETENQCVNCHTSAKKLIEITRGTAKTKPVEKEMEQKGEG